MNKTTLKMFVDLVDGKELTPEQMATVRAHVHELWEKDEENRREKEELYASAREVLQHVISDIPQTATQLYESTEQWPDGFTRYKLMYALRALWDDIVTTIDNGKNPKTYKRKSE